MEHKWLASENPQEMLLLNWLSGRKLRLYACAVARLHWHLLNDRYGRWRNAVEECERFVEGLAGAEGLAIAWGAANHANRPDQEGYTRESVIATTCAAASEIDVASMCELVYGIAEADLLRCISGNPFRPKILQRAWLTKQVLLLAQTAYDERMERDGSLDNIRLNILGDALEEVGCTGEILDHLRSPQTHMRGCWVLDLILGKTT